MKVYAWNLVCRISILMLIATFVFSATSSQAADNLPEQFVEETILSGLTDPVNITTMPDGRMLVLEKIGRIKLFDPSATPVTTSIILGIGAIQTAGERGLASIALSPDFANNGHIFVYYTQLGNDNRNRISRFTFNFAIDQVSGPEVLVWEDNEAAIDCCHYGGGMDFGPDGMLYLATGEEFDAPQAQDLTRAGGKIIRLDVSELDLNGPWVRGALNDHIIPDDNPATIMDGAGPNLDEIWAYGLRNPFRAHWDLVTNRFYMSEVGGNVQATATEDLHVGKKGANYGWPICEGACNDPLYDDPVYFYGHEGATPAGGAIVAGTSYYSDIFPNEYFGSFFIADYALGFIKYLKFDTNGDFVSEHDFATNAGAIVAIEEGADGALYAVDYVGERVLRFSYDSGNQRPEITNVTASTLSGPAPLTVDFSAAATDAEGDSLTYQWFFGDGTEAFGANVTHTYTANGFNNVFVVVSDGDGTVTSAPIEIQVGVPPVATIDFPAEGTIFRAGDTISYSGSVTDPDEAAGHSFEWDIDFFHNAHIHPGVTNVGTTGSLYIETTGHDYHDDTGYQINLIVTDSDGLTGTASVRVFPDKVDLNLSTQPAGFSITVDGLPISTPIAYDTIVDFNHTVSVPESVCNNGIQYDFSNWSNGGARTQLLVVPAADSDLIANFVETGSCNIFPTGGLVAHFESDQGVATTGNTASNGEDPIVAWNDLSGNGNDFNFVAGDPGLLPSALNGNPAVVFDGFDDALVRNGFIEGFPGGAQDRTVFMVTSYDSVGAGGFAYGQSSLNNLFGLHIDDNGFYRINAYGADNDKVSNTLATGAGWGIQSAVVEANQLNHYLNGALIDSAARVFNTNVQSMVLGADHDRDPSVAMQVTALLVYDRALDEVELQEVQDYLQNKYFTIDGNRIPVAATDDVGVENGGTTIINVTANDTDDGQLDLSTVNIVQMPAGGTASVDPVTGLITYTHNGFSTTDTIRYTINDDAGITSNIGVVNITLSSPGDLITNGLVAQFETDSGLNATGDLVLGWDDLSGSGNNLSTFGNPRLLSGQLGDLPVVQFDGVADKLERIGNVNGFPTGEDDRTVFFLVNYLSPGFGGFSYGEALFNQTFGLVADNFPTGQLTVQGWGVGNDFATEFDGVGPDDGWLVQSAVVDAGTLRHYENGQLIDIRNHVYDTSNNRIVMGAEIDGAPFVNMMVGAALVYDRALSPIEQQSVQNYLQIKYRVNEANDDAPVANDDRRTIANGSTVDIEVLANDVDNGVLDPASIEFVDLPSNGNISVNQLSGVVTYSHIGANHDGDIEGDTITYRVSDDIGQVSNLAEIVIRIGTPAEVPTEDLVARYESDEGVDLFGNGQVSRWDTDVFPFGGNDLLGVGAGFGGPEYVPNGLNGLPFIRFDGDDDALVKVGLLSGFQEEWFDRSMYMLVSYKGAGGGLTYGQRVRDKAFGLTLKENGNFRIRAWGGSGDKDSGVPGVNAGWVVQGAVIDDFEVSHTINGEEIDNYNHIYRTEFGLNGDAELVLGADMDLAPFAQMDVAAVFVYRRALSDEEQDELITYLSNKYDFANAGIPVAENDSVEIFSGDQSVISILSNDIDDVELDPESIVIEVQPQYGNLQIDTTTGDVTYAHDGSENSDTFSYSVADNLGTRSNIAVVSIAVDNDASPIALDDITNVPFNGSVTIDVLANDTDDFGLVADSISIVQSPVGGSVSVVDGQVQYQHGGLVAADSFTYAVLDDADQLSNIATVTIELSSAGELPAQGLVAHFESDVGVNFNGNRIESWTDQSGMGNHLTAQGNPVLTEDVFEGLPAISLDGQVDRFERLSNLTGLPTGDSPRAVYFLARYNGPGFGGVSYGLPGNNQTFGLVASNGGRYAIQGWGNGNDFVSAVSAVNSGWAVQSATVFPGSVAHAIDGQQIDARGHSFDTADGSLIVGAEIDGSPQLNMDIAAVLIYDRVLAASEVQMVETYFALKYRLERANNASPVAVADSIRVSESSSGMIAVIDNDQDDGTLVPSSVTIVSQPLNGQAVVDPVTGTIEYTHGGIGLSDAFTYQVTDNFGAISNEAVVTVVIGDPIILPTSDLVAHYEADQNLTVLNGAVTNWGDLSGFNNNWIASGGVTVLPGELNNQDVIQFNGLAATMERTGVLNEFPMGNDDRTVFLVASYDGLGAGGFAYGQNSGNKAFGLHIEQQGLLRVHGYGPRFDFVSNTAGTGAGWIVQSVNLNNGQFIHSLNGETIDAGSNDYNTQPGTMVLGADLDKDPSVQMKVAALLVYDRSLDEAEQESVLAYLDDKYNVISAGRPIANSDIAAVPVAGSVVIDILANDTDDDGFLDPSTVTLVRAPTEGTAVIDPSNGNVTYTDNGTGLSDNFSYTVADNEGRVSVEATVAVFVDSDLDPIAEDDSVDIASGAQVVINVLANDSDDFGLEVDSIEIVEQPENGILEIDDSNGAITYTHNGLSAQDLFTYTVMDTTEQVSNVASVAITINDPGTIPSNGLSLRLESSDGVIQSNGVVTDWTDQSGSGNNLISGGNPTLIPNQLNGLPALDLDGDGDRLERLGGLVNMPLGSDDRTVFLLTKYRGPGFGGFAWGRPATNQAFGAIVDNAGRLAVQGWGPANDFVSTAVGSNSTWLVQSILLEDNQLTHLLDGVSLGSREHAFNTSNLFMRLGSEIDGEPSVDMQVAAVLVYDRALSTQERLQVENYLDIKYGLNLANDASPVAVNDSVVITSGNTAAVAVLLNDSDDIGLDASSVSIVQAPTNGSVIVNPTTGVITYIGAGAVAGDEFTYTVEDSAGQVSNEASVSVAVLPTGLVAHYETDSLVVEANGSVTEWGDQSGQGNDLTAAGDIQLLSDGLNGRPVLDFDGVGDVLLRDDNINGLPLGATDRSIYFVVNYEGLGSGGFAYGQHSSNNTFGLHVENAGLLRVNGHGPRNDYVSGVTGSGAGWLVQSTVLSNNSGIHSVNGSVVDNFTHTFATTAGQMVLGADLDQDPFIDMKVAALLVFDRGLSAAEQAAVEGYLGNKYNVIGAGSPMVSNDERDLITGDSLAIDVLSNDVPVEGVIDVGSVTVVSAAQFGTTSVDALTGLVTYVHDGGTSTSDSFTYTVANDAGRVSDEATVLLSIDDDLSPEAVDDDVQIDSGAAISIAVLSNDIDDNALDTASVELVSAPSAGTATVDVITGEIAYVHDGLSVVDTFSYRVSDLTGQVSNVAQVTLEVVTPDTLLTNNLVLHLDSTVGVAQTNGVVTDWLDQSGSGNDLSSIGDPTLAADTLNGLAVVDFDGDVDRLHRLSGLVSMPTGASDRSVFVVANYRGVGYGGFVWGEADTNNAYGPIVDNLGRFTIQGWGVQNDQQSSSVGTGAGWLVHSGVVESNVSSQYVNGELLTSDSQVYDTESGRIILGADLGSNQSVDMQVAEVLVYDRALSAIERLRVSNYLEAKYSLSIANDDAPLAVDDTFVLPSGGSAVLSVLTNDSDDIGLDLSSVSIVQAPTNGSVTVNPTTGVIIYTSAGAVGNDEFTYTVQDSAGQVSNEASVSVAILPTGLVAHYETDALVVEANGSVTEWGDQSGQGNDLTAAGDIQLLSDDLNGRSVLDFDGVGDVLLRDDNINGLPLGATDRSIYFVVNYEGLGSGGFAYGEHSSNNTFGLHVEDTGLLRVSGHGPNHDYVSGVTGSGAGWLVQSTVLSNNSGIHSVNGSVVDNFTHTFATTAGQMVLGADLDQDPFVDMKVAALLIFDRGLSAAEQAAVEGYLGNKYNVIGEGSPLVSNDERDLITGDSLAIDVLSNDVPVEGVIDVSSVAVVSAAQFGTTSVDALTGLITYTHDGGTSTSDSFTYTVANDAGRVSDEATVLLSIDDDLSPEAVDDDLQIDSGAAISIAVLSNDIDDNALDITSVELVSVPSAGTATVDAVTGEIAYVHDGLSVMDTFSYRVSDLTGQVSNVAQVTLNVVTPDTLFTNNLVLHLDSTVGVTQTNGVVTDWLDQSGNGNDLSSIGDPTLAADTLNGLAVIDFDGDEDRLQRLGGLVSMPTGASDRAVFVVANYRGVGYGGFAWGEADTNNAYGPIVDNLGRFTIQGWGVQNDQQSSSVGTDAGWLVHSGVVEGNVSSQYVNGELLTSDSQVYDTGSGRIVLGAGLGGNPAVDMQVAEVLVYERALSDVERLQVSNYLNTKYSLSIANDEAPLALDDTFVLPNGSSAQLSVLTNDSDDIGLDPSSVRIVQLPTNGTATVNAATGTITYSHSGLALGDEFTYVVSDSIGQESNEARVSILNLPGGMVAHYESDALVVEANGSVTEWGDQSGAGNDLTAAGDVQVVTDSLLNGLPVLDFDGVEDVLLRETDVNGMPLGASDRSMYFVVNYEGLGSGGFAYGQHSSNNAFGLHVEDTGLLRVSGHGPSHDYVSGVTGTGAGWIIQSVVVGNNAGTHSIDGAVIDSYTQSYNTQLGPLVLGADLDQDPFVDIKVAALLIYDRALSASEQTEILTYLQTKYNVTGAGSPLAVDDEGLLFTGESITVPVLANDVTVDGVLDVSSVSIVSAPLSGTTSINTATGEITYTHSGAAGTSDSFTYTVANDAGRVSNEATVLLTIDDDLPPEAVDDDLQIDNSGAAISIAVLSNDIDDNALDITSVELVSLPSAGVATVDAITGEIVYVHDGGPTVMDTFSYTVSDLNGQVSNVAQVTLEVVIPDTLFTNNLVLHLDSTAGVTQANGVVTDWLDQSGNGNDLSSIGDPTLAANTLNGFSAIDFDGDEDSLQRLGGLESMPTGASDRAVFVVANYRGAGYGGFAWGEADTNNAYGAIVDNLGQLTIQGWGLQNDQQSSSIGTGAGWLVHSGVVDDNVSSQYVNGELLTSDSQVYDTESGRIVLGADLGGNPAVDMQVAEVLVYDRALTGVERLQVSNYLDTKYSLSIANDASPVAVNDSVVITSGNTAAVAVLLNDSDDIGLDASSVSIVQAPTNGSVTVNPTTGVITYIGAGVAANDEFTYTVLDSVGQVSNEASVSVAVLPTGLVAHYETDSLVVEANGSVTGWGDQSGQGNDLTAEGDVQVVPNSLNGLPALDFDGVGDVLLRDDNINGLPLGATDRSIYFVVNYEGLGSGGFAYGEHSSNNTFGLHVENAGLLRINGHGPRNDYVSGVTGSGAGWLVQSTVLSNNSGTHSVNGSVVDNFTHTFATTAGQMVLGADLDQDPFVDMQVAALLIFDRGLSAAEQAAVEGYLGNKYNVVGEGSPLVSNDERDLATGDSLAIDVLSNDVPVEGVIDVSSLTVVSAAQFGTTSVDTSTGLITYVHDGGASTSDSFTYTVANDAGRVSDEATVLLSIDDDLSPEAVDDDLQIDNGATISIAVLSNDIDDNALDTASVELVSLPSAGTATVDAITGEIAYVHDGLSATDTFTYRVSDLTGQVSNVAQVSLVVLTPDTLFTNNLVLHLDSTVGVTQTNGVVTDWLDQSGNGNDLSSVGDPTLAANSLNGFSAIDFDGDVDRLQRLGGLVSMPTGASDRAVFLVANYRGVGYGGFAWGEADTNNAYGPIVDNLGQLTIQGWGLQNDQQSSSVGTGAGWLVHSGVVDGNVSSQYVNGELLTSDSQVYDTGSGRIILGADLGGNPAVDMQVAEVLVYDRALTGVERLQVSNYLNTKYSLSIANDEVPLALDDTLVLPSGSSAQLSVLTNDSDDIGLDPSSVRIVQLPTNGSATVNAATGTITYSHSGLTLGDEFTYVVSDSVGQESNEAQVSVVNLPGGMVAHYESDALVTDSGGLVSVWGDQSGQGNDLTAAGDVQVVPNSLNGLPVLDFDGVGDVLLRETGVNGMPLGASDRSMYFVVNYEGLGSGGFAYGQHSSNNTFGLHVEDTGLLRVSGHGPNHDYVSGVTGTGAGWIIQSVVVGNNAGTHSIDGAVIDSYTQSYNTQLGPLVLGADLDQDPFVDIKVAALLIYDRALSASEQTEILTYLQTKYNVTGAGSPLAVDDEGLLFTGESITVPVLANDVTVDGVLDVSSVSIVSAPLSGTTSINTATGEITYTHSGAAGISDSFTYTVTNDEGLLSNEATVSITIDDEPPPTTNDDIAIVDALSTVEIDVLSNDTDDIQIDVSTVSIVTLPLEGTVSVDTSTGIVTYEHLGGVLLSDSFTYTVDDNQGQTSESATVTVGVAGNDESPVAENDFAQVDPGGTVVVTVLDNDTDDVGLDASSVVLVGLPQNGTATVNATGTIDYTHGNVNPGDEFTYTVLDTLGQVSNEATVQISTLPSGLVAHYESNALVTQSGGLISSWGDLSGEGNDLTASGDVQLLPSALNGRPVLDFDGVGDALVRDAGFNGLPVGAQDRSVYMVVNYEGTGSGGFAYGQFASNRTFGLHVESAGLLRVNGHGPNHDYTSDTVGTGAGWLVQSAVLSGNSAVHAVDGVPIDTYTQTYNTTLDKMVLGADLDEDPYVDMQVAAILVFDRALTTAEQTEVQNYLQSTYGVIEQGTPVAFDDNGVVQPGGSISVDVLSNDIDDVALDLGSIEIASQPTGGTVAIDNQTGVITYTHDGVSTGDSFGYTVADSLLRRSNVATVTITLGNPAPVANDDTEILAAVGGSLPIDVLANDTTDGTLVLSTLTVVTDPLSGTALVDVATGNITYTHDGGTSSVDSFTYTISDDQGLASNAATVTINIAGQRYASNS